MPHIALPQGYQRNPLLPIVLHQALIDELSTLSSTDLLSIQTTIQSASSHDDLYGLSGTLYGQTLSLRLHAQCVTSDTSYELDVTGKHCFFLPGSFEDYPFFFEEAERKMCYDTARRLRDAIVSRS